MYQAKCIRKLDLGAYGGAELFFDDVNGDGKPEIIAYQGPGVFGARMFANMERIKPYLPRSQCVTAFDLEGRRLWTWGVPNPPDRSYVSHAYESCLAIGDADNDGKTEVAVALGSALILLDGATGKAKKSASLPEDYFYILHILGTPTSEHEAAIIVKNGEYDYANGPYGQPVIGLNAGLKTVWGPIVVPGAGHHVLTVPIRPKEGNGYLIGYCVVNPDGRVQWTVDVIDPGRLNAEKQHVDYPVVWRTADGRFLFALAGSDRGYVVENGGRTLFTMTEGHVQGVAVGRFQGSNNIQAAFYSAPNGPIVFYDIDGQCLGRAHTPRLDETMTPLTFPDGHDRIFHCNRPILTVPGADRDWIGYADGGWPWGMDGKGRPDIIFPPPEPADRIDWTHSPVPPNLRMNDMGFSYAIKIVRPAPHVPPLVAIYNRRLVWLFAVQN